MVTSVADKRSVGYVRVSTEKQAGSRRASLETQESRIREVVSASGGLLVKLFCDVESGRRDGRPEYRRMIRYVLEEGADTVLIQYLDRFGRNPKEILSRIWELEDHGVSVEATDQDRSGSGKLDSAISGIAAWRWHDIASRNRSER